MLQLTFQIIVYNLAMFPSKVLI